MRPNKAKQQTSVDEKDDEKMEENASETDRVEVEIVDQQSKEGEEKEDDVKDSWDAESSEDEQDEGINCATSSKTFIYIYTDAISQRRYFNR